MKNNIVVITRGRISLSSTQGIVHDINSNWSAVTGWRYWGFICFIFRKPSSTDDYAMITLALFRMLRLTFLWTIVGFLPNEWVRMIGSKWVAILQSSRSDWSLRIGKAFYAERQVPSRDVHSTNCDSYKPAASYEGSVPYPVALIKVLIVLLNKYKKS